MALKQRNQQIALAAELLKVHLPAVIETGDDKLARDLLCALANALEAAHADVEEAAAAWEERGNLGKAQTLRRDWAWVDYAVQYTMALSRSDNAVDNARIERLPWLIPIELEPPARPKIADPTALRGSCQARRAQQKPAAKRAKKSA